MLGNMGTPASCLSAGRRLGRPTPVILLLKVLLRGQVSLPLPQDSFDSAAAALAGRKVELLESPQGTAASLHSTKPRFPSQ